MMCGWRDAFVFVFMVIFSRLQSFIIKNINLFLLHVDSFLLYFFCLINKSFNVYIIVFYGFVRALNMRKISSPYFFLLASSLCSGEITCVFSYFQQFHSCQPAEISESSEEEWRGFAGERNGRLFQCRKGAGILWFSVARNIMKLI
jgi:hypothetical protein